MPLQAVEDAFKEALAEGVFPGAVVLAAKGEEILCHAAFGARSLVPEKTPMRPDMIFDLASLTKPLATAPAIMLLVREKKIRLDDRVTRFFPNFGVLGKVYVTFRQLLSHSSGLPAWKPYFEDIVRDQKAGKVNFVASRAAKHYVFEQIHREKVLSVPGSQALYSDLGYILLGETVEEVSGWTLDRYCYDKIYKAIGLRSTSFIDLTQLRARRLEPIHEMIAPTEDCPWRKRVVCGEVHDDNAYAMGGVAGHAGLFSNAEDIHRLLLRLRKSRAGADPLFPASVVEEFFSRDEAVPGSTFALGWDTPSAENSSSGSFFSPHSIGHLGFTGTSIWWDLEKDCHIILLTNRVHPSRANDKIKSFRPHIHNVIMRNILS
jgi:CubicO group peptidase (beta-lactamase class C family)